MADYQDLSGLPADDTMAQMELQRRLKIAQALQASKMPEGQMVSGHYVTPSWTQYAANALDKYMGGKQEAEAMKQYGEYRKTKEQKQAEALRGFVEGMQPKATTTTQDNFVTAPLAQGMNVPTSPFGTSEQVGQTSPFSTQNMQGDMTTNQPTQATTYTPRSQQDLVSNFYNYAQKSGNPDMANKFALEQFGQAIKPKSTKFMDVGDKQIELDENNKPTGFSLPKGIAPGSDIANQLHLAQFQETMKQHGIENQLAQNRMNVDRNKAPAGYSWGKPDDNGNPTLIPLTGGPADLNKTVPLGNRESVFINRIGIASNETAKDLKNIVRIPLTTSRGVFGGRQQGGSLFDAGKESLTNAMTTQDVQSYNTLASGLQRNLAAIEAAGLAPSGTLTHQMDAVIFKNGDTNYTKLQKLAQIKQIANAGIETTLSNPRLPEKQVKHFENILNEINQAVPFDNGDLITLQQAHQTNPNVTINDIVKLKQKNAPQNDNRSAADAILGIK